MCVCFWIVILICSVVVNFGILVYGCCSSVLVMFVIVWCIWCCCWVVLIGGVVVCV